MNQITTYQNTSGVAAPIGVQIMFDDSLYQRCKEVSVLMSKASGVTPPHLIGKGEACFAVVIKALTWKLDPYSVAASTYQTPGGKIGYEGKLVQAILENSGALEYFDLEGFEGGLVKQKYIGDWDKIRAKFTMKQGKNGGEYPVPAWKPEDEDGLGIVIAAKVKGEVEPRRFTFWMKEAQPRFSTLWAIRPSQQIHYAGVRAFANVVAPGLFMGVPFNTDLNPDEGMVNVTPKAADPSKTLDDQAEAVVEMTPYEMGREAYHAGLSIKQAPRELRPPQYSDWARGHQDAEADDAEAAKMEAKTDDDADVNDFGVDLVALVEAALDDAEVDEIEAVAKARADEINDLETLEAAIAAKRATLLQFAGANQ